MGTGTPAQAVDKTTNNQYITTTMKKTLIALIALAGVASAVERENLWQLTFGTGEGYNENGYKLTNYGETQYAISGQWDIKNNTSNGYLETTGSRRVHTQWHNTGSGLTLGENFGIELVFSIPTGYTVSNHCGSCTNDVYSLILLSTADGGSDIHFGPSAADGKFDFAGSYVEDEKTAGTEITFATDTMYTAQLEVVDRAVTLKIDGTVVQTGTLAESATGDITQILIGGKFIAGGMHTSDWISENVYSVTAYKLVPEPATATLSLLALCGLAARRRRK
ncbi:MAG: PEP-CTERM sorting domain-containing protein [Akkermansia sp.]|nr:PEP-CTERM sorting domain-containing protein [Akkermansia sp.]